MNRTLAAVVVTLLVGVAIGLTYALGPVGAAAALVELFGIAMIAGTVLVLVGVVAALVWNWRREEVDDVEAARRAYADGEIPLAEMERRIDVALDPRAQRLRALVEDVQGVGPETSAAIAGEFGTVEALEGASMADLQEIYGVGPNTAGAIRRRFSYVPPGEEATETADRERNAEKR